MFYAVILSVVLVIAMGSFFRVFDIYELQSLDLRFRLRPAIETSRKIALIEIGDLFEAKFNDQAKKMGKTREELLEAMQDPKNYTPEVWASVQNFQDKVDQEKRTLKASAIEDKPKKPRVKKAAPRIFA